TVSFPNPSCLATAAAAAVGDGYSDWCSVTRRTARAFNSGSMILGIVLILLDSNRSGIKPGALQQRSAWPRRRRADNGQPYGSMSTQTRTPTPAQKRRQA